MSRRDFLRYSALASGGLWTGARAHYVNGGTPIPTEPSSARGDAGADPWIRPGAQDPQPVWGIHGGIQVSLWPVSVEGTGKGGPRGLLRIGYPVLNGGKDRGLVNFIAVEPIVTGHRGYSELEQSAWDGQPGREFWTGDKADADAVPDAGTIHYADGAERLSVRVHTERFANGAQPVVDMEFRADRPGEVRFTVSSAPGSALMNNCVLTATMGNYARLRHLWLRDRFITAQQLWPSLTGNGFSPDAFFTHQRFSRLPGGDLVVCATSDEADPHSVPPDPVAPGWAYRGSFPLTQYLRKPVDQGYNDGLKVRVNGRRVYWASHNPIPGGAAYENFDLIEPFCEGQVFVFGLTRRSPADVAQGLIL